MAARAGLAGATERQTPLVCVSVAAPDVATCRAELDGWEVAEVRLDAMEVTAAEARSLFSTPQTLVATCHRGKHDEAARRELLLAAIEGGAAYVDVDVDSSPRLRAAVIAGARARQCQVILSFHDHLRTPPRAELLRTRERCFDGGADLAKLACLVHTRSDAARLLGLLDDDRPTIIAGMGKLGRVVRIAAPLLGSPIAYACNATGRETAPGQLDRATLERLLREWADG